MKTLRRGICVVVATYAVLATLHPVAAAGTIGPHDSRLRKQCPSTYRPASDSPVKLTLPFGTLVFLTESSGIETRFHETSGPDITHVNLVARTSGSAPASDKPASVVQVVEFKSAGTSPLVSESSQNVDMADFKWRGYTIQVFVHRESPKAVRVLAAVARPDLPEHRILYQWFPATSSPSAESLNLATLEHLYRTAFNEVATGTFGFAEASAAHGKSTDRSKPNLSQAALLSGIADARECVVDSLEGSAKASVKRWRIVSAENVLRAADSSQVAVRLKEGHAPVAGAMVFLRREPHKECSAKTERTGLAQCQLEDTHGHDHDHHEDDTSPLVATYPGAIGQTTVLLPTTAVLGNERATTRPSSNHRH